MTEEGTQKSNPATLIPRERVLKAVEALAKYTAEQQEKSSNNETNGNKLQLIDDSDELLKSVNLMAINIESFSGTHKRLKPRLITVPHSLYKPWKKASATSLRDFRTLLILKDADVKSVNLEELQEALRDTEVGIDSIICGNDLKTTYKAYEARRAFITEFSLILADDNIVTSLPKLLGVKAYEKQQTTPIPIRAYRDKKFSKETLVNSIKRIVTGCIPVKVPRGTTMNVHLGNLEWFTPEELADNVEAVARSLVDSYKIRLLVLKTNQSPALPLYINNDVLPDIEAETKKEKKEQEKKRDVVVIGGVKIKMSTFDKALMEIADPNNLPNMFAKQLAKGKRKREETEESKEEPREEPTDSADAAPEVKRRKESVEEESVTVGETEKEEPPKEGEEK